MCIVKIRLAAQSPKGHLATETELVQYVHKWNTLQPILIITIKAELYSDFIVFLVFVDNLPTKEEEK